MYLNKAIMRKEYKRVFVSTPTVGLSKSELCQNL